MRCLALALAALVAACSPQGDDGYEFERREWSVSEFEVVIVEYQTRQGLAYAAGLDISEDLYAFSKIDAQTHRCEIHTLAPEKASERVWLGHELAHCAWGQWHPSRGGKYVRYRDHQASPQAG